MFLSFADGTSFQFNLGPGKTTRFSYPVTYCFWVGIFRCLSLNYSSQKNLQGRCLLFSYQSFWCFAVSQRVSLNIIPSITMSVKTIFYLFFTFFQHDFSGTINCFVFEFFIQDIVSISSIKNCLKPFVPDSHQRLNGERGI